MVMPELERKLYEEALPGNILCQSQADIILEYLKDNIIKCSNPECGEKVWNFFKGRTVPTEYIIYCASCFRLIHQDLIPHLEGIEEFYNGPEISEVEAGISEHILREPQSITDEPSEAYKALYPDAKVEMMKPSLMFTLDKNKLDEGKFMAGVLQDFAPALAEVAKLGSMNNKPFGKYERGSWMAVENAEERYKDAFWRHLLEGFGTVDPSTNMPHDVAIAWNALALVWFRLKREGKING